MADSQIRITTATDAAAKLVIDHGDKTIASTNKTSDSTIRDAIKGLANNRATIKSDYKLAAAALKTLGF